MGDDFEEDDWLKDAGPQPPGKIRVAAVLWVVMGVVFIFGSCGMSVLTVIIRAKQPGPMQPNPTESCSLCLGLLFGVVSLLCGRTLVRGSSPDTLVVSILSILIGLLYLAAGVAIVAIAGIQQTYQLIALAMAVLIGFGMLVPAGLALVGRSEYLEWREDVQRERRRSGRSKSRFEGRGESGRPESKPWERGRGMSEDED